MTAYQEKRSFYLLKLRGNPHTEEEAEEHSSARRGENKGNDRYLPYLKVHQVHQVGTSEFRFPVSSRQWHRYRATNQPLHVVSKAALGSSVRSTIYLLRDRYYTQVSRNRPVATPKMKSSQASVRKHKRRKQTQENRSPPSSTFLSVVLLLVISSQPLNGQSART